MLGDARKQRRYRLWRSCRRRCASLCAEYSQSPCFLAILASACNTHTHFFSGCMPL